MLFHKRGKNNYLILAAFKLAILLTSFNSYASGKDETYDSSSLSSSPSLNSQSCSKIDISEFLSQPSIKEPLSNRKTIRILSLEGGGTRGMMQIEFLRLLEQQTGKHPTELFDILGGSSIGGVIAAALTIPGNPEDRPEQWYPKFTATSLAEKFPKLAPQLFEKNWWSFWGLFGPMYKVKTLNKKMEEELNNVTFDKSIRPTFITSYDLDKQSSKFFKSWKTHEIFRTCDVVTATACGPTYFDPYTMSPVNFSAVHRKYNLVDGGAFSNMPTDCLMAEAKKLFPQAEKFEIVSVGTGRFPLPFSGKSLKSAGLLKWAEAAPNLLVANQTLLTNYVMEREYKGSFSDWSPSITYEHSHLDDTKPEHLNYLKNAATALVKSRQTEFDRLACRLAS